MPTFVHPLARQGVNPSSPRAGAPVSTNVHSMNEPTAKPKKPKTRTQVREEFRRKGVSIAEWARAHNMPRKLVYEILRDPSRSCERGKSHRIAVLLGLKRGELPNGGPASMNAVRTPVAARGVA